MIIKRILSSVLIALSLLFVAFQIMQLEVGAAGLRVSLLILLNVLYYYYVNYKRPLFLSFLVTFCVAEIINFVSLLFPEMRAVQIDYLYYTVNSLYILSYVFLILLMLRTMDFFEIIKKFPFHIFIMIVLDVFFVVIVTDTALHRLSYAQYFMEFLYNAVVMILLTVALINYLHKDDLKSINLLIGSIFIVFSEVIQLAYFYITDINILNVCCSLFLVIAFWFFYQQSRLGYEKHDRGPIYQDLIS
ncbi:hypothetical protein BXY82_2614 [Gelidibacter sediminis]|uniref:YhhN-like protein n=2 Tax=Gelidibacter sediminis TaxID=1608710 RepID=A0A4R7Q1E1_9FLAO|nr:hypothetical protein BXY82_2614 [Gelidibacter sediminis]